MLPYILIGRKLIVLGIIKFHFISKHRKCIPLRACIALPCTFVPTFTRKSNGNPSCQVNGYTRRTLCSNVYGLSRRNVIVQF